MNAFLERMTPRQRSYAAVGAIAAVSLAVGYGLATLARNEAGPQAASGCTKVLYWYDPMKPDEHFDKPGKSPFMDMQLVPRCADEEGAAAAVAIDPTLVQNFGIRTAKA
jgi:Cu(I)/Ag(I) efflux system membrane fusion protein